MESDQLEPGRLQILNDALKALLVVSKRGKHLATILCCVVEMASPQDTHAMMVKPCSKDHISSRYNSLMVVGPSCCLLLQLEGYSLSNCPCSCDTCHDSSLNAGFCLLPWAQLSAVVHFAETRIQA